MTMKISDKTLYAIYTAFTLAAVALAFAVLLAHGY
jgi:hypothetical protein